MTTSKVTSAQPHHLRAGPLRAVFEPTTGFLRYLTVGDTEVLRGIYAAVRDENWDTVPGEIEVVRLEQPENSFDLQFTSVHKQDEVHFVWQGRITGEASGKVVFSFDGEALTGFQRNRIGFCVLHPVTCAGVACTLEHVDGSVEEDYFPKLISPHQPFENLRAIMHGPVPGLSATVRMTGDTFETEDQRNWTDASFKTYCTPLSEPLPATVPAGTRIRQAVTLEFTGDFPAAKNEAQALSIQLTEDTFESPELGLGSSQMLLNEQALERLKRLKLDHLRLELDLAADYEARLEQAFKEAEAVDTGLELALHLSDEAEAELEGLLKALKRIEPPVDRFLVFGKQGKTTSAHLLTLARRVLSAYDSSIPIGGGTDAFFTELNRARPPTDALEIVVYSLNPQVHAFDDASLTETLPVQAETVRSAAAFSGGKPVGVSPVTLAMRWNPNATGEARPNPGDPRQKNLYGAAWTLGSLKYLMTSGAVSLTYFETFGPTGIMDEHGVYPLYHVFADVAEFKDGVVRESVSSHPLQVESLVLQRGDQLRLLLANMTNEPQTVTLEGLSGEFSIRRLNEENLEAAGLEPERYRKASSETLQTKNDSLTLTLKPHELVRLDGAV